ncbi:MAG: AAA family ATPase [Armatimonadetes bacterium]|nr:AAA family ATPase [Armatimonadota bacterium]MDW8121841.1 AAA family ATPase [Armatimonadota bacterium]
MRSRERGGSVVKVMVAGADVPIPLDSVDGLTIQLVGKKSPNDSFSTVVEHLFSVYPHIIFVGECPDYDPLIIAQTVADQDPPIAVVAVRDASDVHYRRRAAKVGVHEILPTTATPTEVERLILDLVADKGRAWRLEISPTPSEPTILPSLTAPSVPLVSEGRTLAPLAETEPSISEMMASVAPAESVVAPIETEPAVDASVLDETIRAEHLTTEGAGLEEAGLLPEASVPAVVEEEVPFSPSYGEGSASELGEAATEMTVCEEPSLTVSEPEDGRSALLEETHLPKEILSPEEPATLEAAPTAETQESAGTIAEALPEPGRVEQEAGRVEEERETVSEQERKGDEPEQGAELLMDEAAESPIAVVEEDLGEAPAEVAEEQAGTISAVIVPEEVAVAEQAAVAESEQVTEGSLVTTPQGAVAQETTEPVAEDREEVLPSATTGVAEVVAEGTASPGLVSAESQTVPEPVALPEEVELGKLISFISGKGGVGKTTIVVNTALALAQESQKKVALLDTFIGDALVLVNGTPRLTLSELPGIVSDMDLEFLRAYAFHHPVGVDFYCWHFSPERNLPDYLDAEPFQMVLNRLKEGYDYILMDTPVTVFLTDLEMHTLAHEVYVIAVPWDLLSLRATKVLIIGLQRHNIQPRLLLNRVQPDSEVTPEIVAEGLGLEIWETVPNDTKIVVQSISRGSPPVLWEPQGEFAKAIRRIARKLAGLPIAPDRRRWGWF